MSVLTVRDLHVTYPPGVRAVRGISLEVGAGEVLGVVGESGSGKTALALAVLGLSPSGADVRGSVRLRGRELVGRSDAEMSRLRGRDIAMVFQDPLSALTPVHAVGDQIAETIRVHAGATRRAARARAVELLDLVGIPDAPRRARAYPHEFSGGMRRRVMIAMAIANDPVALVADEPTGGLDVTVQAQILDVLRVAREATGAAVLLITHDLGVVAGVADRVMVMYAGRAVETAPVDQIYHRPRMPYTIGLLRSLPRADGAVRPVPIDGAPPSASAPPAGCAFAPRCPVALPRCGDTVPEPAPVGPGGHRAACLNIEATADLDAVFPYRPAARLPQAPPRHQRPVVLKVEDLVRHYRQRRDRPVHAVDGVTFDVRAGETLGLAGESGCGKTTVLMEILNLARPQRGRITVFGEDTAALAAADRKRLRRDLQVVFQDPFSSLDPRMRVADILAEPLSAHGMPGPKISLRVRELLGVVGLREEHACRYPRGLSGGEAQRVGIARALALEPRLLLLDEPVAALDASVQAGVLELLDELRARLDLSYLFVAHDLAVLRHVADRVAIMYHGRLMEVGAASAVYQRPAHPYTRALLDSVPLPDPLRERKRRRIPLQGDPPDPSAPPAGCRFRPRCPRYTALRNDALRRRCETSDPALRVFDPSADRLVACHHAEGAK